MNSATPGSFVEFAGSVANRPEYRICGKTPAPGSVAVQLTNIVPSGEAWRLGLKSSEEPLRKKTSLWTIELVAVLISYHLLAAKLPNANVCTFQRRSPY